MRGAIYFHKPKFWESISNYLTNCVYFDFAHGLYSIGALRPTYTKNVPKMRTWLPGHAYFIFRKLKVFAWNGVGSRGWGKSLDFAFYLPNEMKIPLLRSSTSAMMILINENVQNQFFTKARGFIPKYDQKSIKSKFLKSLKNVLKMVQVVSIVYRCCYNIYIKPISSSIYIGVNRLH